jgi:hypothetical protein
MKTAQRNRLVCGLTVAAIGGLFAASPADAVLVTTTGSDGFGASSFNTAGVWDNAAAPSAGNDYLIAAGHRVRTPADGGSYTFAGDSLTISDAGTAAATIGLSYKGTGNTGTITVDNLILDNGSIDHINGSGDIFNLDGSITVLSDSLIHAKQGPINVLAVVGGSATITNPGSDGDGRTLTLLSPLNTFNGNIVNGGRFVLADDAVLNFVIGAAGVNNSVSGTGPQTALDGDLVLDLSGASTNIGDSWTLVSASSASYGATFNIPGFVESGDVWSDGTYAFDEATGVLAVVPEPAALGLMGLGGLAMIRRR